MGLGISRKQMVMVATLLSGTLLTVLNLTLMTPALPTIMADMSVSAETVQWLTSGYGMVEAVVIPLSAYLMGRFSTRQLFIGCEALFALGSLIAAFAPSFEFILAGRMIQAACTGIVMPMVSSVILLIFPREKRGSAMGIIGLIIGFAPAIGPSLSGILVDHIGWRAIFAIVTVLAFVVVACATRTLQNFGGFERTRFDAPSVVLSTVGLISLLYGFSTFGSANNLIETAVLVVVGALVLGFYVRRQLTLDEPMLKLDILRTRQYRTVVIIVALLQAGLIGMETIMPLYIQGVLGNSATVSGLTLLPGTVIGALIGFTAGRIFDRVGVRKPALVGALFMILGACGLFSLRGDSNILLICAAYGIVAIGVQFTMTPLNTWGVNSLPNASVRYAQSTSNTVNQVAGSFGTAMLVSIATLVSSSATNLSGTAQVFAGYHASFTGTALLLLIVMAIILLFVRDRKGETAKEATPLGADQAQRPGTITVADAMNPVVASVGEDASVRDVMKIMEETGTTGVVVTGPNGQVKGFVTDGNVTRYLARQDLDLSSAILRMSASYRDEDDLLSRFQDLAALNVMQVAATNVITVPPDMPLDKACALLMEHKIKKVPVITDGKAVGSLGRRNIIHYAFEHMR